MLFRSHSHPPRGRRIFKPKTTNPKPKNQNQNLETKTQTPKPKPPKPQTETQNPNIKTQTPKTKTQTPIGVERVRDVGRGMAQVFSQKCSTVALRDVIFDTCTVVCLGCGRTAILLSLGGSFSLCARVLPLPSLPSDSPP